MAQEPIDLDAFSKRLKYGFTDLTNVGAPSSTPTFLPNELLYGLNPDRFNFYIQLTTALMTGDPSLVYRALGIETASRHQRERIQSLMNEIGKELGAIRAVQHDINSKKERGASVQPVQQKGGGYWKETLDSLKSKENELDEQYKIADANKNHPIYSPDTLRATMGDRIVFIAVTFAFRSFALTFLEWSLTNRMVNRTETAIVFYVSVYLLMFSLWALIVNVGKRDIFFKVAFYYINTQGPRGLTRIIIHILMQLLLLPIPFILQSINSNKKNAYLSFEERRKTVRLVGNLSFLMWLVSSIVALRA